MDAAKITIVFLSSLLVSLSSNSSFKDVDLIMKEESNIENFLILNKSMPLYRALVIFCDKEEDSARIAKKITEKGIKEGTSEIDLINNENVDQDGVRTSSCGYWNGFFYVERIPKNFNQESEEPISVVEVRLIQSLDFSMRMDENGNISKADFNVVLKHSYVIKIKGIVWLEENDPAKELFEMDRIEPKKKTDKEA